MFNLSEMVEKAVYDSDDTITYTEALSDIVEKYQIDYSEVKSQLSLGVLQKIYAEYHVALNEAVVDGDI